MTTGLDKLALAVADVAVEAAAGGYARRVVSLDADGTDPLTLNVEHPSHVARALRVAGLAYAISSDHAPNPEDARVWARLARLLGAAADEADRIVSRRY